MDHVCGGDVWSLVKAMLSTFVFVGNVLYEQVFNKRSRSPRLPTCNKQLTELEKQKPEARLK